MGDFDVDEDDDGWEPVEPITSPCDSVSGYVRVKQQKASFNRWPIAYPAGGGTVLTRLQSRDLEMDGPG